MLDPNTMLRLDGRVAVITGSTRGIGLATARMMGRVGAKVVISSRKPEACAAVQHQLQSEGIDAFAAPCHVASHDERERLRDSVLAAYDRVDILVTNAGVNPVFSTMQNLDEEAWNKVFEVNLKAAWRLSQLFLPHIATQGGGSMIMLSSTGSVIASPDAGAYAVAKAGVNHMARQLAYEWGPKRINVNSIAPGFTRTDMIRSRVKNSDAMDAMAASIPLRRIAEPEEIAAAALFLASAGRHITGQTLVIDGGWTLAAAR